MNTKELDFDTNEKRAKEINFLIFVFSLLVLTQLIKSPSVIHCCEIHYVCMAKTYNFNHWLSFLKLYASFIIIVSQKYTLYNKKILIYKKTFPCLLLVVQRGQYLLFYTDYTEFRMKSALIDILFKGNHVCYSVKDKSTKAPVRYVTDNIRRMT